MDNREETKNRQMYSKDKNLFPRKTWTQIFITALFKIIKMCKQGRCSSKDECIHSCVAFIGGNAV